MLIYLCVQTRFRYLIAKYFFRFYKRPVLTRHRCGESKCTYHVNDTVRPWVLVLQIFHVCKICTPSSLLIEEKRKKYSIPSH